MAEYGVTDTGFKRKPKSVTITELENLMKAQFGQDLDVSPESPEGQIISVIADAVDPLWEAAEHSYNAFNPNGATGVTLENLVQINNIEKKKATATTVDLKFSGDNGVTIPLGTTVSSNPDLTGGVSYKCTTLVEGITVGGIYEVLAELEDLGEIQIPVASMTLLDNPIVGIDTVTNDLVGNVGQNDETDPELRSRRTSQVALPAVSTIDAIRAGILNIETILSARIYENDSATPITEDGVTIPPHSIKAIIQGSETAEEEQAIAQEMFIRKDPGIQTDGTVTHVIQDSQGFDKTFKWDNPTLVPFYITIDTTASTTTALPNNGQDIKDAIVAYITDPVTGYKIGDDVSYARLFTPINSVPDHFVQSMKIGLAPSPTGTGDLNIDGGSLAIIADPDNDIVINITY